MSLANRAGMEKKMDYLPPKHSRYNRLNNQAGLTLMELLVALAITVFVGLAIYELLHGIMGDWTRTEANANVTADANIFLSQLGRDIRLAQNPNKNTKAVVVVVEKKNKVEVKNHRLDIYHYDESRNTYRRIEYLVEGSIENGETLRLKRGVAETNDPGSGENPQYGNIANWQILLEGLDSPAIFYDRTADVDDDRRLIEVLATLSDKKNSRPQYTNFKIQTSFMSRSQQLGTGG